MLCTRVYLSSAGDVSSCAEKGDLISVNDFVYGRSKGFGTFVLGKVVAILSDDEFRIQVYEHVRKRKLQGIRKKDTVTNVLRQGILQLDRTLFIYDHSRKLNLFLGGSKDLVEVLRDLTLSHRIHSSKRRPTRQSSELNGMLPHSAEPLPCDTAIKTEERVSNLDVNRKPVDERAQTRNGLASENGQVTDQEQRTSACGATEVPYRAKEATATNDGSMKPPSGEAINLKVIDIHSVFPEPLSPSPRHICSKASAPPVPLDKVIASSSSNLGWPIRAPLLGRKMADAKAPSSHSSEYKGQDFFSSCSACNGGKVYTRCSEGRIPPSYSDVKYAGVSFNGKRWFASISMRGKTIPLGIFDSSVEAAYAYDEAARRYHGRKAVTNFKNGPRPLRTMYGHTPENKTQRVKVRS